jgi:hypothetical protein
LGRRDDEIPGKPRHLTPRRLIIFPAAEIGVH